MASIKQRTKIICMFLLLQLLGGTPTSYALAGKDNINRINIKSDNVRGLSDDRHNDGDPIQQDGKGGATDFIATPSGKPSSSVLSSIPSAASSSIPSVALSSIPSVALSSIPSQQLTECTLNDSGVFSVTSDGVDQNVGVNQDVGEIPGSFKYQLVTSGGNVEDFVEDIQSALASMVLKSLFNGCSVGVDRGRILQSNLLTGFSSSPADEVDNLGCATNPDDGNVCTLVQGKFTLFTTSSDETEISFLQEEAITSVRQSMEDDNANLYVNLNEDIVGISFVDDNDPNLLRATNTRNDSQASTATKSGIAGGLAAGGLVVLVALALVVKRRKSQDESSNTDFDEFSIDDSGVERNLDFVFDENGNAVHNSSKFPQIYESREIDGQQEIGQLNLTNNSQNKSDKGDIVLNRNTVYPTDISDVNCPVFCPTDIL